ncbi:hypothetical protein NHJ13734_008439 [Beauveria thailandica]
MLPTIDNKFGPVLPGKFDFTLLFELVMLGMVPAGIIILLMPFYLGRMLIATHKIRPGPLLWFKLANGTALIAVQLASIISWQKAGLYRSDVSLAASVMSFIASLCVVGLLYISHTFSLHQSSFLSIYLSATMLFDMAMARSYFLRGSLDSLGALQATIAVLKFTLAMIEEIPKHDPFHSSPFRLGPAERGGFWGRALLLWVNPILRLGFAKDFTVDELPHIGDRYESELLFDQFVPIWNKVAAMGTYIVTKKMASARTAWNAKVDSRVAAASNVLAQLKSIKAMGLTDAMSTYLQEKRLDEIETSMIERNCRIIIYGIYGFGAAMTPVAVLAGARFWTRASNPMSVSETFAAYAAIFIAALPLNSLLGHLPYYARENEAEKPEKDEALHDQPSKYAVTMNNVSVNSDFSGPILKDVTLRVPTGSLVMVHGLVSSGKSAFLKTIMGELSVDTGTLQVASKTIAYTSQTPWIRNATIKDNIIGPYPFAEAVYNEVVFACALDKDMADLPDGDNSMAGSYGCNLSGGQKQRLGLARSLFARTSIILLDNILSALDADTAELVFTRVCGRNGLLRRRNSTAIMTTNQQTSLGGLARIQSFCKDTPVEQNGVDMPPLPENWPSSGKIDFNCVTAKYTGPQGEAYEALKNTTVSIQHGQRVRVSGRTGSGKTSMMLALLNLIEFSGSINIDGLSIKMIPRHVLRSSITTMTQDGVELKGTIRINIFPFALTPPTDAEIIATLERVGLWVHIHRQGGLESDMSKSHFSHGQKQLLFLARAILHQQVKQTKIILVDEATSSLDSTTDENMRQLMAEAFTDCTVITIAHQRDYAAEMDIVMELDSGNLLPDDDMTVIDGPRGRLSVSMKQRISLARAVYDCPTTIVLDDPLNTVQHNMASQIYENLFGARDLVFSWECTVIMATNNFGHLQFADALFTVGYDGRVKSQMATTYRSAANTRALLQDSNDLFNFPPTSEEAPESRLHPQPEEPDERDKIATQGQDASLSSCFEQLTIVQPAAVFDTGSAAHDQLLWRYPTRRYDYKKYSSGSSQVLHNNHYERSDADLISMLHRVKLWDAVQRRGGLDASMKRMRFSKAQTQLLSLARGALHRRREDTKVVLIDDAITHLDGHTRKNMYDFIDGEFATCTVLMVAYDLEAIRTADTVITVGGAITGVLERADSE